MDDLCRNRSFDCATLQASVSWQNLLRKQGLVSGEPVLLQQLCVVFWTRNC